jgi:predicted CoA-binding protein
MKPSETIQAFLAQKAIAVVGASRSHRHFGNAACRALVEKGYRIYPVHPWAAEIDGMKCYRRFADLPEPVGGVLIVVPPVEAARVIRDAAAAGITRVWLQQGASSAQALNACKELGVDVVDGECILMFADPKGIHKAHRFVRQVFHWLPA